MGVFKCLALSLCLSSGAFGATVDPNCVREEISIYLRGEGKAFEFSDIPKHVGDAVETPAELLSLGKIKQTYKLGEGNPEFGSKVYNVVFEDGSEKVFKIYHSIPQAEDDVALMAKMGSPSGSNLGFKVAKMKLRTDLGYSVVEVEKFGGNTLADFIANPKVPEELRKRIMEQYNAALKSYAQFVQENYSINLTNVSRNFNGVRFSVASGAAKGENGRVLRMAIKPDNFLVTDSGELVLIDPV